ncbi:YfiR family protein [Colwellia piezophila]|uniref:YfiR family protein n=1 Tax=Colwellia piezophila TaxID=211668 RepID=UPI00037EDDBD|nr:YfiR family protein [Colwellia piezophila]
MLRNHELVRALLANTFFIRYPRFQSFSLIAACLFCFLQQNAYAEKAPEYQLKATFTFHFLDFTIWPSSKNDDKTICIIGRNPFNDHLQQLANLAKKNHKVFIKHIATLNDTYDCHILFISRSETNEISKILEKLASRPILTVSDISSFAANSGMIELSRKSNKTKLIINLNSVKRAGLKLNSNLIDLAQVVGDKQKSERGD